MKYAYLINADDTITFHKAEAINFWTELTEAEYNEFVKGAILDKNTNKLIRDTKAIELSEKQKLISQASTAYLAGLLDNHQYRKLTVEQQEVLDKYLDELADIRSGKNDATELPTKPDFL